MWCLILGKYEMMRFLGTCKRGSDRKAFDAISLPESRFGKACMHR